MSREFRVWAPYAQESVHLVAGPEPLAMTRDDHGWWSVTVDDLTGDDAADAGTRYGFSVDGGDPRPDPRSLFQPDGVHHASALVDLAGMEWTDSGWQGFELADAVLYELHVGTFTQAGTLDAAIEHLDDLAALGIDAVELMPVAAFPGERGWGYDGVHLFAVHEAMGGPHALQRFVDAAHARGIGVVLDVVYNHLGPSGNYLGEFGPYFTGHAATPWGQAANLDQVGSDEVRAYFLDNALMWLRDFHVDGLRLDAVHALIDTRAIPFLEELAEHVDELAERTGVPRWLVAESDRNDPATVTPRGPGGAGGLGLHAQWADDVHHAWHVVLTGETSGYYFDFADPRALQRVTETPFHHDRAHSSFRGRHHGRPIDPSVTDGSRFVVSVQTHDQVGNRAVGDRLAQLAGLDRAAAGAALMLTSPYVPMLFMGEEWAASTPWLYFTDHQEEALGQAIREGRRREFAAHGWSEEEVPDPQDPTSGTMSTLDWEERGEADHARMLGWYQTLIRLRRERPDLRDHALVPGMTSLEGACVTVRRGGHVVVANLGEETVHPDVAGLELVAFWGEAGPGVVGPLSTGIFGPADAR